MLNSQGAEASRSCNYTQNKNVANTHVAKYGRSETLSNCGKKGHGKYASPLIRKKECPA